MGHLGSPYCSALPRSRRQFHIPREALGPEPWHIRRGRVSAGRSIMRRRVLPFFGARGAIRAVLLALLLSAALPSRAEAPETPFAEVFAQLAARLIGVVVNISTT